MALEAADRKIDMLHFQDNWMHILRLRNEKKMIYN